MKTLEYDEDESKMPPHVLAAHKKHQQKCSDGTAHESTLALPESGATKVLLHSCCAPCSGAMVLEMQQLGFDVTVFFYNPNIHPRREYDIRKEENKRFAAKLGIPFVDMDYDSEAWFARAVGMEGDPERGRRCTMCFDMRMERTALYASENGFPVIATTNATSRWKDAEQVDSSGVRAAARYGGAVEYWKADWQTDAMTLRKYQVAASERFYKQEYCGCSYSLRDSNEWRRANGIPKIRIGGETAGLGDRYFTDPETDAAEESQEVVDEFFRSANEAVATTQEERREKWNLYAERKKTACAGEAGDLNNW
mmetsp:Transcript_54433/g.117817  ORF Transcript_54433/g.117817 Transcript_54433/m.117817 type:complete len:310 (+) Transcript_54433:96-1025(+)